MTSQDQTQTADEMVEMFAQVDPAAIFNALVALCPSAKLPQVARLAGLDADVITAAARGNDQITDAEAGIYALRREITAAYYKAL